MSDSAQPHRQQPTRLRCPWDSPGKNTGVGCHFLLQCMKVKSESEVTQSCQTLRDPMDCTLPGSSVHVILQARVLEWGAIAFSVPTPYPTPVSHLFLSSFPLNLSTSRQFPWRPRWKQFEKIFQTAESLCEDKWTGTYRFQREIARHFALAILWSVGEKSLQVAFLCYEVFYFMWSLPANELLIREHFIQICFWKR